MSSRLYARTGARLQCRATPRCILALKDIFRLAASLWGPNRKAPAPEPRGNTQPSAPASQDGVNASLEEIERIAVNPKEPVATRIRALSVLGQFHYDLGRLGKAKSFYRTAAQLTEPTGGAEYATFLNNLPAIQKSLGELAEAEATMLKSIDVQTRLPSEPDSEMAIRWNNLALYQDQGKLEASEQAYQKAISLFRDDGSVSVELRATTLNNLAQVQFATGKLEEAEKVMLEALQLRREKAAQQPTHYANSLMTLAMLYQSTGRAKEAMPLLTDALEIIRAVKGEDHPDYATALNNLAILCEEEGTGSGSDEIFIRAQKIIVNALGERHPLYQTALNNLAEHYRRTLNFEEAEKLHKGVIQTRRETLGKNHPDTLISIENLIASYLDSQQFTLAMDLLPELLSRRRTVFGEEHPEYTQTVTLLVRTCYGLGEYQEAFRYASDAMFTRREVDWPDLTGERRRTSHPNDKSCARVVEFPLVAHRCAEPDGQTPTGQGPRSHLAAKRAQRRGYRYSTRNDPRWQVSGVKARSRTPGSPA
jgi:tetratricopeptide (TPR) repeat protein